MTSYNLQQYFRIVLYAVFGALASNGVTVPDNTRTAIAGVVGFLATLVWTIYGTRLNALISAIGSKTGIQSVEIKVDPTVIPPSTINNSTPNNVTAKAN